MVATANERGEAFNRPLRVVKTGLNGPKEVPKLLALYIKLWPKNWDFHYRQASTDRLSHRDAESSGSCPDGSRSAARVEQRIVGKAGN